MSAPTRYLADIDAVDCRALLATGQVGRIVFTRRALPDSRPVGYVWDRGGIVFAVDDAAVARAIVGNAVAAFETDGFDDVSARAWTVLAVGQTFELAPAEAVRLRPRLHGPWTGGPTAAAIALRPARVTGLAVHPC
ncbi:MAG: pyridoxamine 5'-phosphate oxidase family protein [Pseudonocardia sp.]|uniref:pyridoxamine 5'-phosphate oxidase family protein n=1 Tax=unclassified Pseudonocardia TaxID=2619320 RepID=UPI00086BB7D3|nr:MULTISPECIES: pyridoxamine 5'-phosphate oxidase family protein [unclassified Pseudonocardia]MBN9108169.1 pyridoxamine 5'-phosphate oxidase family protein [Pseudonocardia sp.]ODU24467.1 MAG: hypothetical protein ABS80_12360 [Pseudonocardia sp. SCN 72-51]ODV01653.1 MAG: hypothetical protein ABT15_27060 [Pseudonocardia sp. SCN 73-27]